MTATHLARGVTGIGSLAAVLALMSPGCARVDSNVNVKPEPIKVEPIEVKPIHLTIDVNVRVDRELDSFFDFEKRLDPDRADRTKPLTGTTQPATLPATAPATSESGPPAPPVPPPPAGGGGTP